MDLDGRAFDKQGETGAAARIKELQSVRNAISQFRRLLLHPLVGHDDKSEILARLLSKALMTSHAAIFTRLLIRENRFYLLESVIEDCMKYYSAYAGIVSAQVSSRYRLGEEELRHVGCILSAATGKNVHISHTISERVIGGMEIKMGDLFVDATVKGGLERLKQRILAE
jgi:F-type H+-transporting ATPase subunit delta